MHTNIAWYSSDLAPRNIGVCLHAKNSPQHKCVMYTIAWQMGHHASISAQCAMCIQLQLAISIDQLHPVKLHSTFFYTGPPLKSSSMENLG